jgi:hypothetical protein
MFARRIWLDQQGSALIEGALVIPLLIALVLGVFEFSWLFYQQHLVAIGLRDAADYLDRRIHATQFRPLGRPNNSMRKISRPTARSAAVRHASVDGLPRW